MLRLYYVVLVSLPLILFHYGVYCYVTHHREAYSEIQLYKLVQKWISIIKRNGRIITDVYGLENLPEEGGYMMYSNHQGKYDALGIISSHEKPCTFVIDAERAKLPIVKEVADLLNASKLDKSSMKGQMQTIKEVSKQVKEGRRVLIFPEGGYQDNKNQLQEFMPGTMKCSLRTHTPIVPVALIDSYKPFSVNSIRKVHTEVHYLEPLYYEDYKEMNTQELADLVKERISEVVEARAVAECV